MRARRNVRVGKILTGLAIAHVVLALGFGVACASQTASASENDQGLLWAILMAGAIGSGVVAVPFLGAGLDLWTHGAHDLKVASESARWSAGDGVGFSLTF